MTKTRLTRFLSVLLCLAFVVAIAVMAVGCSKKTDETVTSAQTTEAVAASTEEVTKLGEGEKEFTFIATDKDGKETKFLISSDASTVGAALLENGLIAGDTSEYGLYVKTVNGVTLDFDKDGMYWGFYINGEFAQTGVDSTELVAGSTYSFVATKG